LRAAVAEATTERTGIEIAAEQVFVFPGAQCALHAVLTCIAGPGDEVILLEPAYTTYEKCVAAVDATVVAVALDGARGFTLDVDAIAAAFTPRTRAVIVNSPGNPTGALFDRASLARLTALCAARGVWCVSDEVYQALVHDGCHVSPLATPAGPPCTIIVESLSKSHAMTGWRLGWAVAPAPVAAALAVLTPSLLFGVNQFVQDAAVVAVRERATLAAPLRATFRARRDRVLAALDGGPLRPLPPAGGMFVMVDVAATGLDGTAFADRLLDRARVVVVPGAAFGDAAASFVRMGLTSGEDRLAEAAARMARCGSTSLAQPTPRLVSAAGRRSGADAGPPAARTPAAHR
jgi:arginine:pyruvate transaminase